jgi:hypothetical protein
MYAQIHIFEDGEEVDLMEYTSKELDDIGSTISLLTSMYNIDMYYGHIYDLSMAFCEKYRNPYECYRLYPKNGWNGTMLEVSFEILYDNDDDDSFEEPED